MKKFIIIITILLILFFFSQYITNQKEHTVQTEEPKPNQIIQNTEVVPNDETINISVIGDIMCHNTQYKDAFDSTINNYDFSYVFEDIKKYVDSADLAIGNLETTLAGKNIGYSSYPTFNTPEHLATDLKELGIDVLSTANNHSLDKGFQGIENTINELDNAGILHTGTFKTLEDSNKPLVMEIKGIKIGIISYTYGTNGITIPKNKEYCINLIDDNKIVSDLNKIKNENVDLTIAIMHWGIEYQTTPNEEQKRLANLLIENGVDIILGSHPHVLQKMEKKEVKTDDGNMKDTFIIYSLGNFISGQVKQYTKQSIILNLQVTKHYDKVNKITIDSVNYTPIYMFDKNSGRRYKILDIENEINKYNAGEKNINNTLYNTLTSELAHIHQIIED